MFVDKVMVNSPRKGGGVKIIFEPPFCRQTKPWRQMKSVFFMKTKKVILLLDFKTMDITYSREQ